MSTKIATACLCCAMSAVAFLVICPVANAQPDRQCYLNVAGQKLCFSISNSGSTPRDCYLVPIPAGCFAPTTLPDGVGPIQLPNGQWGLVLPQDLWPPPGHEIQWSDVLPGVQQLVPAPVGQQPQGTPRWPDWDFFPMR
jgi:hypothetical protein